MTTLLGTGCVPPLAPPLRSGTLRARTWLRSSGLRWNIVNSTLAGHLHDDWLDFQMGFTLPKQWRLSTTTDHWWLKTHIFVKLTLLRCLEPPGPTHPSACPLPGALMGRPSLLDTVITSSVSGRFVLLFHYHMAIGFSCLHASLFYCFYFFESRRLPPSHIKWWVPKKLFGHSPDLSNNGLSNRWLSNRWLSNK